MQSLLLESRFKRADALAQQEKFASAVRLVRQSMRSIRGPRVRERCLDQIAELYVRWADSLAQAGRTSEARRLLNSVRKMARNDRLRDVSQKRIAALQTVAGAATLPVAALSSIR